MSFVPPDWITGLLIYGAYIIVPVIIGVLLFLLFAVKRHPLIGTVLFIVCVLIGLFGSSVLWWETYEVPSVQSKVVTVDSWQPKAGLHANEKGMMVIDNANDLMMVTKDGECFLNTENFLFQKFETRDILNTLKPGSKVNLTYYGWRNGFNSGFPNILNATVIDDSHAENVSLNSYFGTKVI
ncbi:DUF1523 family protein [uncultured Methanobrevibacter sp.]|uniref:DUF1523 family protein n=1 Tax=uncultured Methanobrevibacter sp. TaxID=253161 RepID=UPI0025EC76F2|nr:DUF1523 family protein [uncultured Methanobrevibacter sp.]